MSESHAILQTLALAVVLGIAAQLVAQRLKVPAILPLLVLGVGGGPHGLGLFEPASLGPVLQVFIHLGVAIILFEGGLSLDLGQLRRVQQSVRNLLSVGVVVTGAGAAFLVRALTDAPFATAALFGAIVTVTGPTVIAPLLRHMIAPPKVRTILVSEGLMIDPIGAVLAYVVLQWIGLAGLELRSLAVELLRLFAVGGVIGFAAGSLARALSRQRHLGEEMRNLAILALVVGGYFLAEEQAPQSGIVAAVAMGLTLSAGEVPDLGKLRSFKGQLTVLLISVLFILLSGQLDLGAMLDLGLRGVAVALGLILLVRPAAVLVSVPRRELGWRERLVLALTAPRGIVAAAVASLSAIRLREHGLGAGAATLEGLVYLTILVTGVWATAMSILLPRWLGYLRDPSRRQAVLVGVNPLTVGLAAVFQARDYRATLIDSVQAKLLPLRRQGLGTVLGDARDAATYEDAGIERDSVVVAATTNDELNLLIAGMVRDEFAVEHPVAVLQHRSEEFGRVRHAWVDLVGGRELDLAGWCERLGDGSAVLRTFSIDDPAAVAKILRTVAREQPGELVVVCGWSDGRPVFRTELEGLERYRRLTVLASTALAAERLPPVEERTELLIPPTAVAEPAPAGAR